MATSLERQWPRYISPEGRSQQHHGSLVDRLHSKHGAFPLASSTLLLLQQADATGKPLPLTKSAGAEVLQQLDVAALDDLDLVGGELAEEAGGRGRGPDHWH